MGDLDVRRRVLARLIDVGASHNRYYVGDVVATILTGINETAEAMMAVDVLRADAQNAAWFKQNPNLRAGKLAQRIDDVLYGEL
jgi:hypothetical protein